MLLGVVGAVFAWSYAAFPLLALPLVAHAIAHAVRARALVWKPAASVALGVSVGVCLHPNFPTHLEILAVQLFDVSLEGSGHNLEFAAPGFSVLFAQSGLVFVAMLMGLHAAWRVSSEHREEVLAWAVLTGLSCVLAFAAVFAVRRRGARPASANAPDVGPTIRSR